MMMKRVVISLLIGVPLCLLGWILALPHDWTNWLGFSRYDYFTAGTNYAFTSGPGPMILTALGFGTIISGLWHAHNCHYDGCWSVGKHRINGTPWCSAHQDIAREMVTTDDLLRELIELLKAQQEAKT